MIARVDHRLLPPQLPQRSRFRFVDDSVEEMYRKWHLARTLPFVRVGLLIAGMAWVGNWLPHLIWARPLVASPWMLGLGAMGMWALAAATFTARGRAWSHVIAGVGVLASGTVSIVVSFEVLDDWPTAAAGVVIIAYFGLTVFRLRPGVAAISTGLVIAAFQLMVVLRRDSLGLETLQVVSAHTTTLTAFGTGLVLSAFVDRLERMAFGQERLIAAQAEELHRERQRVDELLLNVLPESIVERLKVHDGLIADSFDDVSIVFADVVGFTPMARGMEASEVVELLNDVFTAFDALGSARGVEKIKTIGDAWMGAAGVPVACDDHAIVVADLALEMRHAIEELNSRRRCSLAIRVGIATGTAVAGVIGTSKFSYDLWGDTVNLAARLESHGVPGMIQVSEETARSLHATHVLRPRGEIDLKGLGSVPTWFLDCRHVTIGVRHHRVTLPR